MRNWLAAMAITAAVALLIALISQATDDIPQSDEGHDFQGSAPALEQPPPASAPSARNQNGLVRAGTPPVRDVSEQIVTMLDDWSSGSDGRFLEKIEELRSDQHGFEDLADAFIELDTPQRFGHEGRRLVYALGFLGDLRALDLLEDVVRTPTPTADKSEEHGQGPRLECLMTKGMALTSFRRIIDANVGPQAIARFEKLLRDTIDSDPSPHMRFRAIQLLLAQSKEPQREMEALEARYGAAISYLLDVTSRPISSGAN